MAPEPTTAVTQMAYSQHCHMLILKYTRILKIFLFKKPFNSVLATITNSNFPESQHWSFPDLLLPVF